MVIFCAICLIYFCCLLRLISMFIYTALQLDYRIKTNLFTTLDVRYGEGKSYSWATKGSQRTEVGWHNISQKNVIVVFGTIDDVIDDVFNIVVDGYGCVVGGA